jgi:predicted permease
MTLWNALIAGLRRLLRRRSSDRDLEDEIRHYAEMAAAEHRRAGLSSEEAARAARVELGSLESVKEQVRSSGWEATIESAWRDVTYVARMLRRSPGFATVAVLVLALGIGVNTAIFSIVNAVLFRPLPVQAPSELGYIYSADPRTGPMIYQDFLALTSHGDAFAATAAITVDAARLRNGLEEEQLVGEAVSASYFDTLGVAPTFGRVLADADDALSAEPVVVISDSLWRRRFAADPDVLGKPMQLDWPSRTTPGRRYTIVGVMSPRFKGVASAWTPTDYWVSLIQRGAERNAADVLEGFPPMRDIPGSLGVRTTIVRLAPGIAFPHAAALVSAQPSEARRQLNMKPISSPPFVLTHTRRIQLPFDPSGTLDVSAIAIALLLIGTTVVLIAAANLTGLLTARGMARRKEIAVRLTIGAGRWRIARQLLTEGLVLSALGAAAGLLLAELLVVLFLDNLPAQFGGGAFTAARAVSLDVTLDGRVLAFTAAIGIGVGLLMSLAPVRQAFRTDLAGALSGTRTPPDRARSPLRHWVVMAQVCLSLVLLLLAAISVRTLLKATMPDPGYRPEQSVIVTFAFNPLSHQMTPTEGAAFLDRRDRFQRRLLETVQARPDVTAAALTMGVPAFSNMRTWIISRDGYSSDNAPVNVSTANITPDYFKALGIPLLRGRTIDDRDGPQAPKVAVVCERVAASLWPGRDPIGQWVALHPPDSSAPPQWLEVVGVVKEVKPPLSDGGPSPWLYTALNQQPHPYGINLVARTDGSLPALIAQLRQVVVATDPNAQVVTGSSFTAKIEEIRYPSRMAAATLSLAGVLGLLLAGIGLYGVMSYSVAQRLNELGIRAALGAGRRDIVRLVLTEGTTIAAIGSAVGFILAFIALRLTSSRVVAVPAPGVAILLAVPLILAGAVLLACYIPARRAAAVDPVVVLRRL